VKFFNIDCHISVVADIKNIFEDLGHNVDHWSLSGHKWVFGLPPCPSSVITEDNWKSLDEAMVDRFYKEHASELDQYDAFICGYPPCFLKLFERFNKPIIVVAATRYDFPFCYDPDRLNWLEDSLNNNKNLILVANNHFDKNYCEHFLSSKWEHIPSLCAYTGAAWSNSNVESVVFSKFSIDIANCIHQSLLKSYRWEDLYGYKSILHFPYNVSTMSIFEQSYAGVPLLFPSLDFAMQLLQAGFPIFSEIVFPNQHLERQAPIFLTREWLELSDFYCGVIDVNYFDDSMSISESQISAPAKNKDLVYSKWSTILEKL
jgi:hypothetical protein